MSIPPLQYRPKARVAQRKERSLPKRKAASSTPAVSAKVDEVGERLKGSARLNGTPFSAALTTKPNAIGPSDSAILARIREKTRLRVQKFRKKQKG